MRPDPLAEAAARRHQLTRSRAVQALRELDRAGVPVTFAGVAQASGVSRSWLYTQPDISSQIRRLRHLCVAAGQARRRPRPQQAARGRQRQAPPPARPRARRPAVETDPNR
jgi:hypothetical protein